MQIDPAVAIIALGGKFPGANNPDQLWSMLKQGKTGISVSFRLACIDRLNLAM